MGEYNYNFNNNDENKILRDIMASALTVSRRPIKKRSTPS